MILTDYGRMGVYEKYNRELKSNNMTQKEAVIEIIKTFGGVATLNQIYQGVFKYEDCKWNTKTPFASIRCILQRSPKEIYKIKPGLYGLIASKKQHEDNGIVEQTDNNENSEIVKAFNHTYYQGLLLEIGRLHEFETFVPVQDKNKIFPGGSSLGEMSTLERIPSFTFDKFVQRSSTIDVIWFNKSFLPNSFFEVEHSTDIQNSLLKYYDLRDFAARMVIVADSKRRPEFDKKLGFSAFASIKDRVKFLSYESLDKQYNQEIQKRKFEFIL